MPNNVLRSYNSFSVPDSVMNAVISALENGMKKARSGSKIQRLELSKKGYRQDIVIGDLYVIPASVCASSEGFPSVLLMAELSHITDPEFKIAAQQHLKAGEELTKEQLQLIKTKVFTDAKGKAQTLIVYVPAWADKLNYRSFLYDPETLYYWIRDYVFCTPFNPSLSATFDQIRAIDEGVGYKASIVPEQQHLFKVAPSAVNAFPDLVKSEDGASKTASYKPKRKLRFTAADIPEVEKEVLSDDELELINGLETLVKEKVEGEVKPIDVVSSLAATYGGRAKRCTVEIVPNEEINPEPAAETVVATEDKKSYSLVVPGRVLENFYPELQGELVEHPEGNAPDPDMVDPISGNKGPRPAQGLSGFGGTYQLEGVPLRREVSLRGPNFQTDFYGVHDDLDPRAFMSSLNKTASAESDVKGFIKLVLGDFVASLVAGFSVTKRPLMFEDAPGTMDIPLQDVFYKDGSIISSYGAPVIEQMKTTISKIGQGELKEIIDDSWAQAAVWSGDKENGYVYEVYARAKALDTMTHTLTIEFVAGSQVGAENA